MNLTITIVTIISKYNFPNAIYVIWQPPVCTDRVGSPLKTNTIIDSRSQVVKKCRKLSRKSKADTENSSTNIKLLNFLIRH